MDAPIVDHSQDTPYVSPSFDNEEDQSFIENPFNFSYSFFGNIKGEHSCLSSTPLCDSSNHEDANKHPKFSYFDYHDLSTSSFDHDIDSIVVNLSKTLVYVYLSIDEVETLQIVEAL